MTRGRGPLALHVYTFGLNFDMSAGHVDGVDMFWHHSASDDNGGAAGPGR